MKYEWNPEKNAALKQERNISFEEIIFHLSQGDLWKTADHPDQEKYPGQKLYFVCIDEYIYMRSACDQQRKYLPENHHSKQKSD